ncbi:SGNH/GDSL hydrolase family protein [Streptomyces sp. SID5475]|nr:SGNH/GDSL hydrolase family protein [Streptomyces sp. SID5475]
MSVSRARVARRIAAAAAYGGGGAGLLGGAAVGLLLAEMRWARRLVGVPDGEPPRADGCYGASFALLSDREPLRLGFLGDSTAAGQGVHRARETPGALLASGLAAVAERPVLLRNVALSGAMSGDLDRQVSLLLADRTQVPHTCVIMIGANDVTNRVPAAQSVRLLSDAVRRLREAGCQVVVGTCPDLGTIEPVYQPLRWVARRLSRQLAAAQTIGVVEQGGRTVSLGSLLGPEFEANPRELFGPDNYHPSAEGYATAAMAVLPTLCAALGLWPEERLDVSRAEGILPVAQAAARAASAPRARCADRADGVPGSRGAGGSPPRTGRLCPRTKGSRAGRCSRTSAGPGLPKELSKRLEKRPVSHTSDRDPGCTWR